MVFNRGTDSNPTMWWDGNNGNTGKSVTALNGLMMLSTSNAGSYGADFIGERWLYFYNQAAYSGWRNNVGGLASRNSAVSSRTVVEQFYGASNSALHNEVALTVYPNAPIDSVTGLPTPTIAVATNGGVNIITDTKNVVGIASSQSNYTLSRHVSYSPNGDLVFEMSDSGDLYSYIHTLQGPNVVDNSISLDTRTGSSKGVRGLYRTRTSNFELLNRIKSHLIGNWPGLYSQLSTNTYYRTGKNVPLAMTNYNHAVAASTAGLNLISEGTPYKSAAPDMVAGITSTFNSGWLCGDIKGAWLSSTSTTSLIGTELITNGTFDANITGWTASSTPVATLALDTNRLKVTTGFAYQTFPTVVGNTYIVSYTVTDGGGFNQGGVYVGTTLNGYEYFTTGAQNSGTYVYQFIAQSTTTYIQLWAWNGSTTFAFYDNVSVRLADTDRTSNNKPLGVFGTIGRSVVASGSNLVGYSGFSTTNYLMRAYESSLVAGTGAQCVMTWLYTGGLDANLRYVFCVGQQDNNEQFRLGFNSSAIYFDYGNGSQYTQWSLSNSIASNKWTFVVAMVSAGNVGRLFINGVEILNPSYAIAAPTTFLTSSSHIMTVGTLHEYANGITIPSSNGVWNGSISLLRYSFSLPSPEQITKIYNDELALFQPNSQCTLYGTSDAVTAMAYDDSTALLHVGTSSGRSDFRGLERINNTTTAVTTAISASNGLISEQ
jgi:hypothetical protein